MRNGFCSYRRHFRLSGQHEMQILGRRYSQGHAHKSWWNTQVVRPTLQLLLAAGIAGGTVYTYSNILKQKTTFDKYDVAWKQAISFDSNVFGLKPNDGVDWSREWQHGLWSVEIKQPQLQIAREYTPLPPDLSDEQDESMQNPGEGLLEFWIRREENGEVSNYLHKLSPGDQVELRGPKHRTEIPDATEFVFLAGGTGLAPALQLVNLLLLRAKRSGELPKVHILWANRRREDCVGGVSDSIKSNLWSFLSHRKQVAVPNGHETSVLVRRLDKLKHAFEGRLQIDYYVDEEGTRIAADEVLARLKSSSTMSDNGQRRIVIVCGRDGFVAHFAGPRQWVDGQQIQGPIAGVLQNAHKLGWEVIKL